MIKKTHNLLRARFKLSYWTGIEPFIAPYVAFGRCAKNSSFAQLSLAWLLHQPVVSSVIYGATQIGQINDNLSAIRIKFSSHELHR